MRTVLANVDVDIVAIVSSLRNRYLANNSSLRIGVAGSWVYNGRLKSRFLFYLFRRRRRRRIKPLIITSAGKEIICYE